MKDKVLLLYKNRLDSIILNRVVKDTTSLTTEEKIKAVYTLKGIASNARNIIVPDKTVLVEDLYQIKQELSHEILRESNSEIEKIEEQIDRITSEYLSEKSGKEISLKEMREQEKIRMEEETREQRALINRAIDSVVQNSELFDMKEKEIRFLDLDAMSSDDIMDVLIVLESAVKRLSYYEIIKNSMAVMYSPLYFRDSNPVLFLLLGTIMVSSIVLFKNYVLGVFGIVAIVTLFTKTVFEYMNRDILAISSSVVKDKDKLIKVFNEKIGRSDRIREITEELLELTEFSNDEELQQRLQPFRDRIEEIKNDPVIQEKLEEVNLISEEEVLAVNGLDEMYITKQGELTEYINSVKNAIECLDTELRQLADSFKTLGRYISQDIVFTPRIEGDILEYEGLKVGSKFKVATTEPMYIDKHDQLKLYILNYITNIKETLMNVRIVDPLYLGKHYAEFYTRNTADECDIITTPLLELLPEIRAEVEDRIRKIRKLSVEEFNKTAAQTGKIPIKYLTYIVVSDEKQENLLESKELTKLLEVSNKYGIQFIFGPDLSMMKDVVKGYEETSMVLTDSLTESVLRVLQDYKENGAQDVLLYKDLLSQYMGDQEMWSGSTLDNIDLILGWEEGDLTKVAVSQLGECGNVHSLWGGESGSGKSNALNVMLLTTLHKYGPEQLQVWLIDFKRNTAAMYAGDSLVPHFRVLSGTKDGAYAESIFDELIAEQTRRQKIFSDFKMQKIKEYNKAQLKGKLPEGYGPMPRVLVVFDEYQAMYKAVDPKISDRITVRISQLASEARSVGIHMLMCSQSTDAALPATVLKQFKLRCALRCDSETSSAVIGNKEAENLPTLGWLIFNEEKGKIMYNRKIRVPYLDDAILLSGLKEMADRGKNENRFIYNCEFFDEELKFQPERLIYHLDRFPNLKRSCNAIVLGDRLDYSPGNEPIAFLFAPTDGANIILCGVDQEENAKIIKSLLLQMKAKEEYFFLASLLDENMSYTVGIKDLGLDLKEEFTTKDKFDEIVSLIYTEVQTRKDNGWEGQKRIVYFICGASKSQYFVDKYGKIYDAVEYIARNGPEVGVHLFVYSREHPPIMGIYKLSDFCITTTLDESASSLVIGTSEASKLREAQAIFLENKIKTKKFKVYQHQINRLSGSIEELMT